MGVDIRMVPGSDTEMVRPWWRRFNASVWEDWSGVVFPQRHNWSDFTLIAISGEIEWCMSNAEIQLALLGLHLRITWYWESQARDDLRLLAEGVKDGTVVTVPFDDIKDRISKER